MNTGQQFGWIIRTLDQKVIISRKKNCRKVSPNKNKSMCILSHIKPSNANFEKYHFNNLYSITYYLGQEEKVHASRDRAFSL